MIPTRSTPEAWGPRLARALRAIRRGRGFTTAQMAQLMHMDRRNYANFEAGKGRLNLARVLQFAEVTDSDAWAILAAVLIGASRLAIGSADNKLLLAFLILLAEFEKEFGEALRTLDTADAVAAFRQAFVALEAALLEKRARLPSDWLQKGAAGLGLGSIGARREEDPC
jgi:transcriptional regulator with XRE-family HTH domain